MPYIGSSPATTALTADDIADGAITTAKINDDAVTLAKFASGTDGNIITYDASGNPAAVSTGSSGQILTSAGSGSPPTFASAAAGGKILQVVNTSTGALATGTTAHVLDDTIPQNSEGNEVMTLAITPASSSNYLIIEAQINGAVNSDVRVMAALYQDSTANALAVNYNMFCVYLALYASRNNKFNYIQNTSRWLRFWDIYF